MESPPTNFQEYICGLVERSYREKDIDRLIEIGLSRDYFAAVREVYRQHGIGGATGYTLKVAGAAAFKVLGRILFGSRRGEVIEFEDDHTPEERFQFEMFLWYNEPAVERVCNRSGGIPLPSSLLRKIDKEPGLFGRVMDNFCRYV